MLLRKEFVFDAAHNLIHYHGKCEALHGHTYRLAVVLEGEPDAEGMILDFRELSSTVRERVISRLDHAYINDIIEQPTAENIASWIWERIEEALLRPNCRLSFLEVWETASSCVALRAEDRPGASKTRESKR
ncbi:MAG: 6-carboxytetrahydropterin synthase QueD [Synergistaceae bacterium]|jgi:6-pyruvoyltetrahydropterin/6-carboxytetrahydropterin synthase|nr:6-carboxytetrahydropterin synthase QueD [Synergistaceae bacterium]